MELEEIYEQIDLVGKQELEDNKRAREGRVEEPTAPTPEQPKPVDLYNEQQVKQYNNRDKKERHGSDPVVNIAVDAVLQTLVPEYRKTKGMVDHLQETNQLDKANAVRNQYMMDYYLPGVEAIIMQTSPDDLLNNSNAMEVLEGYSLALGDAKGYLRGYLMNAYGNMLGQVQGQSDQAVANAVRRLIRLGAEGETRAAISLAKRVQKDIDAGLNVASEGDYGMILKVANAQ